MFRPVMRWYWWRLVLVGTMVSVCGQVRAQSEDSEQLQTRIFDIRQLLLEVPDYRATISDLRGDDLYASGGQTIFETPQGRSAPAEENAELVIDMIKHVVDPENWDDNGGMGTLRVYAGQLVAANGPQTLAKVEELLNLLAASRTSKMVIKIYFVAVPNHGEDRGGLSDLLDGQLFEPARFDTLLDTHGDELDIVRASLSGLDGQRIFTTSGKQHNVVVGTQAVVATSSAAHQPVVRQLIDGVTIEVQPVVDRMRRLCLLDLRAALGKVGARAETVWSQRDEGVQQTLATPTYHAVHFATSVTLPLDKVSLVGMTRYDEDRDVLLYALPGVSKQ